MTARRRLSYTAALALGVSACAPPSTSMPPGIGSPAAPQPIVATPQAARSGVGAPTALGTLRQDDIAIVLQPEGVRVTAIPLDESVIRTLAPDSYRALESRLESKRALVTQRAAAHDARNPSVWYVVFSGLAADARFVPTDFTVTSGGRDYRPFDVIPLSAGFGEQRLQPRETQSGLLLFEDGIDVSQPLTVSMGTEHNTDWETILHKLDAERAAIRARGSPKD